MALQTHFHKFCFASESGTVTARWHLYDADGASKYYESSIATTGQTGYDICVAANAFDSSINVGSIVGADLIYSNGTLYSNTTGTGGTFATATVPTSTTGKKHLAVSQDDWVFFGQVA